MEKMSLSDVQHVRERILRGETVSPEELRACLTLLRQTRTAEPKLAAAKGKKGSVPIDLAALMGLGE